MENFKLNWRRQPVDNRDKITRRGVLFTPSELPVKFQLDKEIPIYDQGDLGSCTANSGCACYRYEYAQLKNTFDTFDPSRLYLYYNTRKIEGSTEEDAGAYIRDVFKALNKDGLCEESLFPYYTDRFATEPSPNCYINGKKYQTVRYAAVPQDLNSLKSAVFSGAAISFGFDVYKSFMYGSWTEICPIPNPSKEQLLGGHAVTIIGWDDNKKAFLIQNSWGSDWKNKGKFYMPYEMVTDNKFCDDFWVIDEIKVDDAVTPVVEPVKDTVKRIFTRELILDASKSTIVHLADLVGCKLVGAFRSNFAKQLVKYLYG